MKKVFAASYSTLSPAALAPFLAAEYGLQNVQCRFMVRGVGDTYHVNTQAGPLILRIYRHGQRTLPQIQAEVELLMALQANGVPVSYPLAALSGRYIQAFEAVEGTRFAILFTFAAGKPSQQLTHAQLVSLGHGMAQFHNVSSTIQLSNNRWEYNVDTTFAKPLAAIKYALADDSENYAWLQTMANLATAKLIQVNTSLFSKGYCHFDFLPKNFHFEDDKITFFDFDFFGHGWLVNDVMTFWQHLTLDVYTLRMAREDADKAFATFVKAYRGYRPLSGAELAAIPFLSPGFWLFYMGFHATHDQFQQYLQPSFLKPRIVFLKTLVEKYWPDEEIQKLASM